MVEMDSFFSRRAPFRSAFYGSTVLALLSIGVVAALLIFGAYTALAFQNLFWMPIIVFIICFFISSFSGLIFIFGKWLQDLEFSKKENVMISLAFLMHVCATLSLFFYQADLHGRALQQAPTFLDAVYFIIDQFSKGAFNDIFDVFDLKLSGISIEHWQPQSKFAVLCLRIYSGLFLVFVFLSLRNFIAARRRAHGQA